MGLASLEYVWRRTGFADSGLSSWPVSQLERRATSAPLFVQTVGRLFEPRQIGWAVVLRLVACVYLVVAPEIGWGGAVALSVVLLVSVALVVRCPYGHDGADQMMTICTAAYLLANLSGQVAPVVWFVAAQSALSYLTAGVAKLVSPVWRSGSALPGILRTRCYGNATAYRLVVDRPHLDRLLCRAVITFECTFPLALVGVPPLTVGVLLLGIGFHAVNAVVMRLNTFFVAFVATYPALAYCSTVVAGLR